MRLVKCFSWRSKVDSQIQPWPRYWLNCSDRGWSNADIKKTGEPLGPHSTGGWTRMVHTVFRSFRQAVMISQPMLTKSIRELILPRRASANSVETCQPARKNPPLLCSIEFHPSCLPSVSSCPPSNFATDSTPPLSTRVSDRNGEARVRSLLSVERVWCSDRSGSASPGCDWP